MNNQNHWDKVYSTKQSKEVSWTQDIPSTSLDFIKKFKIKKNEPIIDIGGGDSNLVDFLLSEGYSDITILDISHAALERAKVRLGNKSVLVKWIVSDITTFKPERQYMVWHDRATFHFLTMPQQVKDYIKIANNAVNGYLAIGTFSDKGPETCSGLEIKQYSAIDLNSTFSNYFSKIECIQEDHKTPFNTLQNFTFCTFKKKEICQ